MANLNKRRTENQKGHFFVDSSCINCGTCYFMAPDTFCDLKGQSAVYRQPQSPPKELAALQALFACPTHSIGQQGKSSLTQKALASFPLKIGTGRGPQEAIYHCGFHAESSFGAASYYLRLNSGNILVDSPRFNPLLVRAFNQLGGLKYQFLTHKDDVADTDLYHKEFSTQRVMHKGDVSQEQGTEQYEIILQGEEEQILFDSRLKIIPVPGHTRGHCVLLLDDDYLFTGDHLSWSLQKDQLIAFKNACWYDWETLKKSMEKLLTYSFKTVLPGHGAPYFAPSREEMHRQMEICLESL